MVMKRSTDHAATRLSDEGFRLYFGRESQPRPNTATIKTATFSFAEWKYRTKNPTEEIEWKLNERDR